MLASNIANADTPGYIARDFKFSNALRAATYEHIPVHMRLQSTTDARHIPLPAALEEREMLPGYAMQSQPSLDRNSVDMDRERAAFADNAVRYEATLRFINGNAKTMLSAIQGQ